MTTYYVRKTGLDTNDGLTPAAAFLTIDKAANTVAAGDTVYIGAGTYAELVTMDTSGASGSVISFIGDVTGRYTGDAGLVIISAFDDGNSAPARASCLDWNGKEFIVWTGVVFNGGSSSVIISNNGNVAHEGDVLQDCAVLGYDYNTSAVTIYLNTATTPDTAGFTIRRCALAGCVTFSHNNNTVAEQNMKAAIENCICFGDGRNGANNIAIRWFHSAAGTYGVGGLTVRSCTITGAGVGVQAYNTNSTTYPVTVQNCLIARLSSYAIARYAGTAGSIVSDYNRFLHIGASAIVSGLSLGANDEAAGDFGMHGGIADWPLYRFWGWSPFAPWEPIAMSGYTSPLIGVADSSTAPSDDAYGNPRPMGRNTDDIGAVEARNRPVQETTTVRTGTYAMRFDGAGWHDLFVPVNAEETTISVYARKDSNYTGDAPLLEVYNIPGVADQSDAMAGAADTWEELSCTFTPTAAGMVRVRMRSRDTSATGEAFFDDLART